MKDSNGEPKLYSYRFDEKLKLALAINVSGTKEMLALSKEMENLKVSLRKAYRLETRLSLLHISSQKARLS